MALGHIEVCTCGECVTERANRPQVPAAHVRMPIVTEGKTARQVAHERRMDVLASGNAPGGTEPLVAGGAESALHGVASSVASMRHAAEADAMEALVVASEMARGEGAPLMSAIDILTLAVSLARQHGST